MRLFTFLFLDRFFIPRQVWRPFWWTQRYRLFKAGFSERNINCISTIMWDQKWVKNFVTWEFIRSCSLYFTEIYMIYFKNYDRMANLKNDFYIWSIKFQELRQKVFFGVWKKGKYLVKSRLRGTTCTEFHYFLWSRGQFFKSWQKSYSMYF